MFKLRRCDGGDQSRGRGSGRRIFVPWGAYNRALSSSPTMRCSRRGCTCTSFQRGKASKQCKNCGHHHHDHSTPNSDSGGNSGNDSDNGRAGKRPTRNKNRQVVSSLVSDVLGGGKYIGREVESAQDEARAGLMKRHVGCPASRLQSTI